MESSSHIDPDQDADGLDAMLNGLTGVQDRANGSDAETPPGNGATPSKEETPGKEYKLGKGDKPGNSSKEDKLKSHAAPTSGSESAKDPEDILESWVSTIMKDVQAARKIYLVLKAQPTQRYHAKHYWMNARSSRLTGAA